MRKPNAAPITCRDTTWLASDARERALSEDEKAAFAEHVATCVLCQGASSQFEMMLHQLGRYLAGKDAAS